MQSYKTFDQKILINCNYGGFGFSDAFRAEMARTEPECYLSRDDPRVVDAAVKFGLEKASGKHCDLYVKTIPAYRNYRIEEYDGAESVVTEFPWKEFAMALYYENKYEPILLAVQSGEVCLPDD